MWNDPSTGTPWVFVIGSNNAVFYEQDGANGLAPAGGTWQSLGGYVSSLAVATDPATGGPELFGEGSDSALWSNALTVGGNTLTVNAGWQSAGGAVSSVAAWDDPWTDTPVAFGVGSNGAVAS